MNYFHRILTPVVITSLLLIGFACSNMGSDNPGDNFDRVAMLENYANNSIIPSYQNLQSSISDLQKDAESFTNDPTETNLQKFRNQLKNARLAWQDANFYQFGPAEMQTLRTSLNTYPADTSQINQNIESGEYTLGTLENRAAAGFPALGYLLYGIDKNNAEILGWYTTDPYASNRKQYLQDNISFIQTKVDATLTAWQADGGNYIGTFTSKENSGTDVGSSLGMIVNAAVLHYERFIRDGKIGIPAGVRSSGIPRPSATEAFYAGYSLELAVANMNTLKRLIEGRRLNGQDGIGLDEYLQALDASQLSEELISEIDQSIDSLQSLNDPLSDQINNDLDPVLSAFEQLQQVVPLLKADMPSVLGVSITFQDNDGD